MFKKFDDPKEGKQLGLNVQGMGTSFSKVKEQIMLKLQNGVETLFQNWLKYCAIRKQDISDALGEKIDAALKLSYLSDELVTQ